MRSDKIKGVLAALAALALLLSFAACMPAAAPISGPGAQAPTEAPDEAPAPTEEPEEEFIYLFVKDGGVEYPVYEHFRYGQTYYPESEGMLHADGAPFYSELEELYDELPVFVSGPELDVSVAEGCRIIEIHAFDTALRPADTPDTPEEIGEFLRNVSEELIIDIVVRHDGNYIESLGEYEFKANGYAFRVVPEAPTLQTSGFMQVFCNGEETPVIEHFGWSMLYDEERGHFVKDSEMEEFEAQLPELHYSLPCFECGSEIDLRLAEGCEIIFAEIYDVYFRPLEEYPLTFEQLLERVNSVEEETIFDIYVLFRGRLISEAVGNEVWINGYTFRVAPKDAPIVTPSPEPQTIDITPVGDTVVFDDLDLFAEAVREAADDPDSVLHGLAGYYLLENKQASAKGRFKNITVTSETVEVLYSLYDIDWWDADEGDPNRFVLTWYRNLGEADAEALVNTIVMETPTYFSVVEEDGVWIVHSYEDEKHGVWVNERGDLLMVTAPLVFDDPHYMLPLARADWVPIS